MQLSDLENILSVGRICYQLGESYLFVFLLHTMENLLSVLENLLSDLMKWVGGRRGWKYCLYKKYKNVVDVVPLGYLYSTKHVFSCVPSDGRVGRMHSNTDYIRLILLHCVFSNVSSNCLPQRMQNYTGGICRTFLHYGLSYVSSKNLDQSHTGCIFLTFLHCVFKWFLKLPAREDAKLHCLHLLDLYLLWAFICLLKLEAS